MLSFKDFKEKYPKLLALDNQNVLNITTITSIYHFDVKFNITHIADNIPLNDDFIINIKYGDNKTLNDNGLIYYRAVESINNKPKKKNKTINKKKYIKHDNINKQLRIEFRIKKENIKFKFKLFENGTIQSTGSKNIISVLYVIYNLFELLKTDDNYLLEGYDNLKLEKLKSFNCSLINCKSSVDFNINRIKTFKLLLSLNLNMLIKFDPLRHASISIKFNDFIKDKKQKDITIFIFEKGTILINGATNYKDLIKAYKFITLIILKHKTEIKI